MLVILFIHSVVVPTIGSFNPRTHMGCDEKREITPILFGVSIHAPTWGATSPWLIEALAALVSIHAPTWGATDRIRISDTWMSVSIHAPTWGATEHRLPSHRQLSVSIHAPTWGATVMISCCLRRWCFNPRTHMGCDCSCNYILLISNVALSICESIFFVLVECQFIVLQIS